MDQNGHSNGGPKHTDWATIPVEQLEEGIQRQMVIGEKIMMCRLRFAPHTVTPAHDHPHEQMTLVERGPVLFTIGNEERVANTGDVLHFPSGTWHGATMLDQEVILVDIFSPIREDFLT
ncbi:MAG TPA: cupin domain-containing protein [Pyrinomonadaceae bacterium]|jgi:quercetin dioxygenase-like cupin family protein|nr:cupin domain-containing protein [Pyrinomonadaceae bacterium]